MMLSPFIAAFQLHRRLFLGEKKMRSSFLLFFVKLRLIFGSAFIYLQEAVKMVRNIRRFALVLVLSTIGLGTIPSAQAQYEQNIFISSINSERFPEITLKVRVVNADGRIPSSLTNKDLAIFENGASVSNFQVVTQETGPMYVIFVFDQGRYSNLDAFGAKKIQELLFEFQRNYMRDGIDTVAIMSRVNQGLDTSDVILAPTHSTEEFIQSVQNLSFRATAQTQGLKGIEEAYTNLSELLENKPGRASTAIIYIGRMVEAPSEAKSLQEIQTLAVKLIQDNVQVYTWHTDRNGDHSAVLNAIAENTGGQYGFLQPDQDNFPLVKSAYAKIMEQARVFRIEYRSMSGISGMRRVVVVPAGTAADSAVDGQDFSVQISAPRVNIIAPKNQAVFTRNGIIKEGSDEMVYDINSITVTANLEPWEDGFPRQIVLAELLVDQQPRQKIQPEQNATRFEFTLDITNMLIPGTHSLPVQVRLVDELGREGISPSVVPDILVIKPETVIVIPAPPSVCEENPNGMSCWLQRIRIFFPWLGLVVMGVMLFITRRQVGQLANSAGRIVKDSAGEIKKTLLGGSGGPKKGKLLATLHVVIGGKGRQGGEIKIYNLITTLGRDPARSDFQLFDEIEKSTVSGCHCTVTYDQGQFWLTDNNSTNGTQLNSINIIANEPYPLKDGDEIVMGDVFNAGARLRFVISGDGKPENENGNGFSARQETWGVGLGSRTELDMEEEGEYGNKPMMNNKDMDTNGSNWMQHRPENKTELDMEDDEPSSQKSSVSTKTELDVDLEEEPTSDSDSEPAAPSLHWKSGVSSTSTDLDLDDFDHIESKKRLPKSPSQKNTDDWLKELD
jgi:pSer/pThr/pTyr-binding forkhead associated (FHA) protein